MFGISTERQPARESRLAAERHIETSLRFLLRAGLVCLTVFMGCGGGTHTETASDNKLPPPAQPDEQFQETRVPAVPKMPAAPKQEEPEEPFVVDELPRAVPDYRKVDVRPKFDRENAIEHGIQEFKSKRLQLWTDIDPNLARPLPNLADQLYEAHVAYFGELPPAREESEYQVTGYLIDELERFQSVGMVREAVPSFVHGRHLGYEFWMNNQEYEYYRRHLMLHEATHCFMTAKPDVELPLWYLEGMAEYFATHTIDDLGKATFGAMPDKPENYVGFGRIEMIQEEVAAGRFLNLDQVAGLDQRSFSVSFSTPYAWSWALCMFLNKHPHYRDRFQELGQHTTAGEFFDALSSSFNDDRPLLAIEWEQFAKTIDYGFDFERNAFRPASESPAVPANLEVAANRGWQATGIWLEANQQYTITATGQVTLANEPKPWVSEPQGVSIRYFDGKPIGQLLAGIVPEVEEGLPQMTTMAVGRELQVIPKEAGELYLRVNDFPNELADNAGMYRISISR